MVLYQIKLLYTAVDNNWQFSLHRVVQLEHPQRYKSGRNIAGAFGYQNEVNQEQSLALALSLSATSPSWLFPFGPNICSGIGNSYEFSISLQVFALVTENFCVVVDDHDGGQ
ncbi:unnamed protein product [Amoebophrya sp. A120]|nr:unnamed protein product [Amoebophrya sp. A120]|eukprot:GSA120T00019876001.1